jgi:predicted O-methyltransferase YrrM
VSAAPQLLRKVASDPGAAARFATKRARAVQSSIEGARDARRLRREHPRLVPQGGRVIEQLRPLYERYVAEVSSPDHAISWESVSYLTHLCEVTRPRRALDLGSGFSSFLLRHYAVASADPVAVVSVDDSETWLARTRQFLLEEGLEDNGLRTWADFSADPGDSFDLIFHDLAGGELRNSASAVAAAALAPRGLIVFDDAHHSGHRRAARRAGKQTGLGTYSLHRWTADRYGRFAMLGAP